MKTNTINAVEFGVASESPDNTLALRAALEACAAAPSGATLRFSIGVYHFRPDHTVEKHLWISNNDSGIRRIVFPLFGFDGLTIDGGEAEFIFHGAITPFAVIESRTLTLKNFVVDYAEPVTLTGSVAANGPRGVDLLLDPNAGYDVGADGKLTIRGDGWKTSVGGYIEVDPTTHAPLAGTGDTWLGGKPDAWESSFREIGPHQIRFKSGPNGVLKPGSQIVFLRGDRDNPCIFLSQCTDVRVEDVRVYQATAMALIAQRCTDITVHRLRVELRPGADRFVTATADATHFVGCRGTVRLLDCLFEGQLDDPANIHGTYTEVLAVSDTRELVLGRMHTQQKGVPYAGAGDRLRLYSPDTMEPVAEAVVADAREIDGDSLTVTLTDTVPAGVAEGQVVENLSWTPDVEIRGCTARRNRARGFLISTPGSVLIEGNTLSPGGAGILIPGESKFWFESGAVRNVMIRNNTFIECNLGNWGLAAIDITPHIPEIAARKAPFHRNIRVENNRFVGPRDALLAAWSVDGLTFTDNEIEWAAPSPKSRIPGDAITLRHCRDVTISGNRFIGDSRPAIVAVDARSKASLEVAPDQGFSVVEREDLA